MKHVTSAALATLILSGCAGGLPPSSDNGLNKYDVILGLKTVPEGADTSRIWSPVHQISGSKPTWSVVWFKEKTKNGKDYELTAQPGGHAASTGLSNPQQYLSTRFSQLTEKASSYIGNFGNWITQITAPYM